MGHAIVNLDGKPIPDIIEKVRDIVNKMTGNVNFTTPSPGLPLITTAVDKLETDYQAALDGGKSLKTIMRLSRIQVLLLMSLLRDYVQNTSEGDDVQILSSGFGLRKKRAPVGELPPPGNVRVGFGLHPGELIVRWGGVPLRSGYKVQITSDLGAPVVVWTDLPNGITGKVRLVVGGLNSGSTYWFRVFTYSTVGLSGPSGIAGHMAP
jgi:hypothetical protein